MKILLNPLISRESHSWFLSSLDIDYDGDVTRSYSWEPTEKLNLNMGLHGRSLSWSKLWNISEPFDGLNHLFVDLNLDWLRLIKLEANRVHK